MKEKFKSFLVDDNLYVASLILVVGVLAFLLGRLSVDNSIQEQACNVNPLSLCPSNILAVPISSANSQLSAQVTSQLDNSDPEKQVSRMDYVASKAGTKYHHVSCPGAKQIKEENKIYFPDIQTAMSAGYTKAANCNH